MFAIQVWSWFFYIKIIANTFKKEVAFLVCIWAVYSYTLPMPKMAQLNRGHCSTYHTKVYKETFKKCHPMPNRRGALFVTLRLQDRYSDLKKFI